MLYVNKINENIFYKYIVVSYILKDATKLYYILKLYHVLPLFNRFDLARCRNYL